MEYAILQPADRVCCFICGVPPEREDPQNGSRWTTKYRALVTEYQDDGHPMLPGRLTPELLFRQEIQNRIYPHSFVDPGDDPLLTPLSTIHVATANSRVEVRFIMYSYVGRHFWEPGCCFGYPVHSACWSILSTVAQRSGSTVDADSLHAVCRSFPTTQMADAVFIAFGHDYKDGWHAQPTWSSPSWRSIPRTDTESFGHFWQSNTVLVSDPLATSFVQAVIDDAVRDTALVVTERSSYLNGVTVDKDPFLTIPSEILEEVLILLDSVDAASLRRASPTFASLLLSDAFWRSRFDRGREMEHIFETTLERSRVPGHWGQVYSQLRTAAALSDPTLSNRRRIWRIASGLFQLSNIKGQLHGAAHKENDWQRKPAIYHHWVTASSWVGHAPDPDQFYHLGQSTSYRYCRLPGSQPETSPSNTKTPLSIWVSIVSIFGKTYVSGLRLETEGEEAVRLGFTNQTGPLHVTKQVTWSGTQTEISSIMGFHLALDFNGIRGMAVLSNTGEQSEWIGDKDGMFHRRLISTRCISHSHIEHLEAEFDALKLVELTIVCPGCTIPKTQLDLAFADLDSPYYHVDHSLWHPEVPYYGPNRRIGIDGLFHARDDRILALHTFFFGGKDGESLSTLTELATVFRDSDDDLSTFEAFEATHKAPPGARETTSLTRPDNPEHRSAMQHNKFAINGPGGERITRVRTVYADRRGLTLDAIELYTNEGSEGRFEWPDIRYYGDPVPRFQTKTLDPAPGHDIIGFCMEMDRGQPCNLGIMYIPSVDNGTG